MKYALQIPLMGAMAVMISSCGNFASSLNSQNFDPSTNPLDSPGTRRSAAVETGPIYAPGTYVEVTNSNAVLYHRYPKGNAQPDQTLSLGTPLKVVGEKGSYGKVETKNGQIGFVPAIMVGIQSGAEELPPLPGIDSIEPVDPNGFPPLPPGSEDLPFVAPEPEVPPISVEETGGPIPVPTPAPTPVVPPNPLSE